MGFFQRLKEGLSKTRGNFTDKVDTLVKNTQQVDEDFYEELTDILILSDAGVQTSDLIIETLRNRLQRDRIKDATKATIRCIPFDAPVEEGTCVFSGKPSHRRVLFARSY